jgi:hypothetical protein
LLDRNVTAPRDCGFIPTAIAEKNELSEPKSKPGGIGGPDFVQIQTPG